jgi:SAM-dependent methyltransferase
VQRWVAGSNGNLYVSAINKLNRYPIPRWPGPAAPHPGATMLDIGCGWGRWMVSAARAGWTPFGIDVKKDAAKAAMDVLRVHGCVGAAVSADLTLLPFADESFDMAFSYSVLQHVSRNRANQCLREILRVLRPGGHSLIELPLYPGLTNWRHGCHESEDPNSWDVRYYRWRELPAAFSTFSNIHIHTDCILGIGVRWEDTDLLPWRYKPIPLISELFRLTTLVMPVLTRLSDSVYVWAQKPRLFIPSQDNS